MVGLRLLRRASGRSPNRQGTVLSFAVLNVERHCVQGNVCDSDNECVQSGGNNEGGDYDFHCYFFLSDRFLQWVTQRLGNVSYL